MSKYDHEHRTDDSCNSFIKWCAEQYPEWQSGKSALACFKGQKFSKNTTWCDHHKSLSLAWNVCTKARWEAARAKLSVSS